ncbi:auxin-responsive protein IAA33 [Dioscorea cayenensis subsp. rotundata]|uniref:Auxin-responsive protein n=1 Tax=Dioscorea cayennensis subsp. rotundata TaxID=55577 RepID=A0AB40AWA5_DIOCR|nr:auxin-responsive protein IAA33 [Dioscorea cayenensis subsp. rotundata]
MNGLESQQEAFKRRWNEKRGGIHSTSSPFPLYRQNNSTSSASAMPCTSRKLLKLSGQDDDLSASVVPPVTVVLEGRSICHRIHLHKHAGYESLAAALRRMFVDTETEERLVEGLNLSNAVPGYIVAYEDMEDDLLLVGDLNWKDFVRVAKRIRIIPVKSTRQKQLVGRDQ